MSVIFLPAPQFCVIGFLKILPLLKEAVSMRLHVQLLQYVRNSLDVLHVFLNEKNWNLFFGA